MKQSNLRAKRTLTIPFSKAILNILKETTSISLKWEMVKFYFNLLWTKHKIKFSSSQNFDIPISWQVFRLAAEFAWKICLFCYFCVNQNFLHNIQIFKHGMEAVWPDLAKSLANFWQFFGKMLYYRANFHCYKWPNIET